jgi:predicted O-linked N-acetylglucosamine transferase (SPINDLY family)
LGEHVVEDGDQYVQKAVWMAGKRSYLVELRKGMRERMKGSCLMDAVGFARGVEGAFGEMVGGTSTTKLE